MRAVPIPPADSPGLSTNSERVGPVSFSLVRLTPLTTKEWPFHDEKENTSGLAPVMFSRASREGSISTLTLLENIVGAFASDMTKPSPAANVAGADLSPERTEVVVVNIMIDKATTIITLGRIRRMAPPP